MSVTKTERANFFRYCPTLWVTAHRKSLERHAEMESARIKAA
jgi:hypothetical protein